MSKKITIGSLFFWTKKKKEETFAERVAALLPAIIKAMPELREALRPQSGYQVVESSDGAIIGQLYDFIKGYDGTIILGHVANIGMVTIPRPLPWTQGEGDLPPDPTAVPSDGGSGISPLADKRIVAKPKDIEQDLERIPTPWNNQDEKLDEKIKLLADKTSLTNQRYVKAQIDGMLKRLQNRKKYKEVHDFYEKFPNTSDEKIDELLKKYKLTIQTSELFIPTFPQEAIDVMKEYTEVTKKITGETPVFYVIAEEGDFQEKYKKNDPILLVQSPFGFYWQILGAWDEEMLLLHEL